MDDATLAAALLATPFAAALLPLTLQLLPVIARIGQLIVHFRATEPTPSACCQFETQLHDALRDMGRIIVEWTYNHLEPDDRHGMPGHLRCDGDWYRRRDKSPTARLPPCLGPSPCGVTSTSRSTASNGRSFPWNSASGWRPVVPRRPWRSAWRTRPPTPPKAPCWQT